MRMFSKGCGVLAVLALVPAAGCLRRDLTHTIYVSPSGVTWSAMDKDVRSDDPDPGNRLLEEHDYFLGVQVEQHGIARALRALNGTRVQTKVLRGDRPFTVLTEARFNDLAALAAAMMKAAYVRGDATTERDGCERTVRVSFDPESGTAADTSPLAELMSDAAGYRIVLTEGRFVRAEGFTIESDGGAATPGAPVVTEDGLARAALTWIEGWCAGGE